MGIGHYIKDIGRGKEGARDISRTQAADLMGQILDAQVSPLELGAFCIAMRIKGETPDEMAGFLDAVHQRMQRIRAPGDQPVVVIPSYNGARKLPLLTPLLALLLAREGLPVLVHGANTEASRVSTQNVLAALAIPAQAAITTIANGEVQFATTAAIHPQLQQLLEVRHTLGLRNSAHSLVKLLAPCDGAHLLVSSYTHPTPWLPHCKSWELPHCCYAAPKVKQWPTPAAARACRRCEMAAVMNWSPARRVHWPSCLTCPATSAQRARPATFARYWTASCQCRSLLHAKYGTSWRWRAPKPAALPPLPHQGRQRPRQAGSAKPASC